MIKWLSLIFLTGAIFNSSFLGATRFFEHDMGSAQRRCLIDLNDAKDLECIDEFNSKSIKKLSLGVSDAKSPSPRTTQRMARLKDLETLEIDVFMPEGWGEGIGNCLQNLLPKLQLAQLRLDLSFNLLLKKDIQKVAQAIKQQENLQHLILSFHRSGLLGEEAEEIIAAVSALPKLKQLRINFSDNVIDDESAYSIMQHLKKMTGLVALEIHFHDNFISPDTQEMIEQELIALPNLLELETKNVYSAVWLTRNVEWAIVPNINRIN